MTDVVSSTTATTQTPPSAEVKTETRMETKETAPLSCKDCGVFSSRGYFPENFQGYCEKCEARGIQLRMFEWLR
jgi:Zn finger protein HypA/HybF involved in hydrogenase expression